ncbi:hypothetical protein LTR66_010245 [Elasticomyces elasticus]|nr:hypothetical protein LTR66_010245 [Elasticomyces elasticus]
MLPLVPTTHRDVTKYYIAQYEAGVEAGIFQPFIYPWGALGATAVLGYLLVDHRTSPLLRKCRYLVFTYLFYFAASSIKHCRARNPASAFGIGLLNAWSILWIAKIMLFDDCQTDYKRIERKEEEPRLDRVDADANGSAQATGVNTVHGHAKTRPKQSELAPSADLGTTQTPRQRRGSFSWQGYPSGPFIERLDWVADVFSNFRGVGWNWQSPGLPPPPSWVQEQLDRNSGNESSHEEKNPHRSAVRCFTEKGPLLRANLLLLVGGYLLLDLLKTGISHDPYFWGVVDPSPPAYLPHFVQNSSILLRSYRLVFGLVAVYSALQTTFVLGPLFFVGVLGPAVLGARGEPWMYPSTFGSYTVVFDKGLAGWWGAMWHQTFREAFATPSKRLIEILGMNPKSLPAKSIQLLVAFALSGCLHAAGSYTQTGDTSPLSGPFLFFILQPLGIISQMLFAGAMEKSGVLQKTPRRVRQAANFIYVHVWFYYTGGLLLDDFCKGGILLFEPIPISLFRGLGLGAEGDSWWCWWNGLVHWASGEALVGVWYCTIIGVTRYRMSIC